MTASRPGDLPPWVTDGVRWALWSAGDPEGAAQLRPGQHGHARRLEILAAICAGLEPLGTLPVTLDTAPPF